MKLLSRYATRALAAAALLALVPFSPLHATAVAAPEPTVPGEVPTDQAPADTTGEVSTVDPANEIVQSWTLTTGGGPDGSDIGGRPNFTYQVQPGAVIEDTVVVFNLGNVTMQYQVYATDAFNNVDGQFDLLPADEVPVDAGSWVQLVQETIILEPGKQATIPFTLTVPLDATPGDHVGAIVAGSISAAETGSGQVVDVERRTGTRLYVQVDGELTADLAVSSLSTDYAHSANSFGGSAEVSFSVENRGNVRLGGTPVISVGGPFGIMKQEITLDPLSELLPGQTIDLTASLDGVPALFLDATEVRIDIDEASARGGAQDVTASANSFTPPITILLLLAFVMLALLVRRSLQRRRMAALPVAPSTGPASGELRIVDREPQHQ